MSFMDKISTKLDNAAQLGMDHPLKGCSSTITYVNVLATVIAATELEANRQYAASVLAELGVKADFSDLVAECRKHPDKIDIDAITGFLKSNDCFTLLLLDAAMIAPDLYDETQTDVWSFIKKLHSLLDLEKENDEWYPAIFQFATALAKAKKAPDFLVGTTTKFYIRNTWAHILKYKKLYADDAVFLPELCQAFTPGQVGAMFQNNNFATDNGGELLLGSAMLRKNIRAVEFLLSKGTDINATNKSGETALDNMGIFIDVEMLDFLLDQGATISDEMLTTMLMFKEPEMVASLMRHQVELPVERIVTTMIKTENIRAYLENGGDPNLTCDGQSWIDNAIVMERREIVELLKEFGAVPSPGCSSQK